MQKQCRKKISRETAIDDTLDPTTVNLREFGSEEFKPSNENGKIFICNVFLQRICIYH
jgi:hypothetical protein